MYHTITITPSRVCGGGSILNFDIFYKETCLFFIFYHEKHFYPEAYEDAALTPAPMCIILLTCTRAKLPPIIFHFSEVLSIFPIWAWKKTNKIKLQDLWIFNLGISFSMMFQSWRFCLWRKIRVPGENHCPAIRH